MSGVTDSLLAIAAAAGGGRVDDALVASRAAARASPGGGARRWRRQEANGALGAQVSAQFDDLVALVRALGVLREVSPRTLDVVAAAGELLSSRIVAAALNRAGVPAEWVDARRAIITNGDHTRAVPLAAETSAALAIVGASSHRGWPRAGARRLRRLDRRRSHDDAGPRRVGLLRRASSAPASARARFRSGPTSTAC